MVGTNDPTLSDHLKVFIQTSDELVVGIIGEGSTRELTSLWEAPFQNDTPGSMFSKAGGIAQMAVGRTSMTTLNSTQVWGGTTPLNFTLTVEFYAVNNAYNEVQAAVIELEKAASPELNNVTPFGRVPEQISINVGRQIIYPECIITSVSKNLDGPIGRDGYPLTGEVQLQIQAIGTVNKSDIPSTFG